MEQSETIPELVRAHFTDQKASGLSIAAYCKERNIRASTFYGWNKRYKEKPPSDTTFSPSASFLEIPVRNNSRSPSPRIRITRTEMEFPPGIAAHISDTLKALLSD